MKFAKFARLCILFIVGPDDNIRRRKGGASTSDRCNRLARRYVACAAVVRCASWKGSRHTCVVGLCVMITPLPALVIGDTSTANGKIHKAPRG